jgi:hypothetical protein
MPKSSRAYRSAKRSRELDRLRKQEEKRRRRQHKGGVPGESGGTSPTSEGTEQGSVSESEDPGTESI